MTTRTYESDDLQVLWDSQRCVHVAACIRALPGVFNPLARPWVRIDAADAAAIVDAVELCPTGALRYVRKGGPQEVPDVPTTIEPVLDGPFVLRGDLQVIAADGTTITHETRLALCRCGASANKPFCDSSHRRIGFQSNDVSPVTMSMRSREASASDRSSSDARDRAESPNDVGPPQPPTFTI